MKYLGLLCDFDGTLHLRDHNVSARVTAALQRVKANGVKFGIITGRHFEFVQPYVLENGFDGVHVACGGAQLVSSDGRVLQQDLIPAEIMQEIAQQIDKAGGHVVLKVNGALYGNHPQAYRGADIYPLSALESWHTPSFYAANLDDAGWQALMARTDISLYKQRYRFDHTRFFADGLSLGAGKRLGAEWWCHHHGLSPDQVVGIGDGENDLGLFETVGLKLAMGNGVPELLTAADDVLPTVEEDGVVTAIERYFGV